MLLLKILLALVIAVYVGFSFFLVLPLSILHFMGLHMPFIVWESTLDFLLAKYYTL